MKFKLSLPIISVFLFGCSFTSNNSEIVDHEKEKDHYEQNHSCDRTDEELNKLSWFSDKPYKKVATTTTTTKSSRTPSSNEELYDMLGNGCDDLNKNEINEQVRIANLYGREIISPMNYRDDVPALQNYLNDIGGVTNFSAAEMTRPNKPSVARRCKLNVLLPLKCRWSGAVVQGLMAEKFREVINEGRSGNSRIIRLRNWYRPQCYNSKVGGASKSDHRWSRGFDLDFPNAEDRAKAQRYLCRLYKDDPFNLQVGIGCRTLHVGVGSPKGTRFWTYGSLKKCPIKRLSGDDCWRITTKGRKYIHTDQRSSGAL